MTEKLTPLSRATSGDPDQTPRIAASDLGLHCLPLSNKKDARLIWVKVSTQTNIQDSQMHV